MCALRSIRDYPVRAPPVKVFEGALGVDGRKVEDQARARELLRSIA